MPIKITTDRPPNPELERLLRECRDERRAKGAVSTAAELSSAFATNIDPKTLVEVTGRDARHAPRTRPFPREKLPRRRLVLTNGRVAVITGVSCAIAAAFATLAFLDLAEMQGQDRERAIQISVIVSSFLSILWLAAAASLPRRRQ